MHVVVTGASAGIGEGIARAFSHHGADVTLVARRRDRLQQIAGELMGRTHVEECDLSDTLHSSDWLSGAIEALGPVDVLVNNAGMQILGPLSEANPEFGDKLLRLNLMTPTRLAIAVLPAMIERGEGTIVNIASVAAMAALPGQIYYSASKAGLAAVSEALRGELRGSGVQVVTVYPGPVVTALATAALDSYDTDQVRRLPIGRVDVLAEKVVEAVRKKRPRVIYPRGYGVTGWLPAVSRWVVNRLLPMPKRMEP